MCKLKRLAFTAARKLYDFVRPGARIRRRLRRVVQPISISPERIEGMRNKSREAEEELIVGGYAENAERLQAFRKECERRLATTKDPQVVLDAISTIAVLSAIEKIGEEIFSGDTDLPNSEEMLRFAARDEKDTSKN